MKFYITFLFLLSSLALKGQTIWNGQRITFNKPGLADWTLPQNQDRITDSVWITRADQMGLFNIALEEAYENEVSPMGTEWSYGTTAEINELEFKPWVLALDNYPPGMVGKDMVVHLIKEDIYIDIKFTFWDMGNTGGGFAYERATDLPVSTSSQSYESLHIFPNPCTDRLQVKGLNRPVEVRVLDNKGREVYSKKIRNGEFIPTLNWTPGLYYLTLENKKSIKFVKW